MKREKETKFSISGDIMYTQNLYSIHLVITSSTRKTKKKKKKEKKRKKEKCPREKETKWPVYSTV